MHTRETQEMFFKLPTNISPSMVLQMGWCKNQSLSLEHVEHNDALFYEK
jgi:hypothetical protein